MTNVSNSKPINSIPYSVLDLVPILEGGSPSESYRNTIDLARHVEHWGYHRYWLAEHHNMPGIGSSATSVLIGQVAAHTSKMRVGAGGIMLPNHAPLVVAEQFGTLESLFPGRIDLGLGRAPGTDPMTAFALRRHHGADGDDFPRLLAELIGYFQPSTDKQQVRAIPGEGLRIPIWLLGSSGYSAQLAGLLGLPFAFASHFSPENTLPALALYRDRFRPSDVLSEPYAMVAINIIAAETDEEAEYLFTSVQQQILSLIRGTPARLSPPVKNMDELWNEQEKKALQQRFGSTIVGSPQTVREKLQRFLDETQANEIMVQSQIYDHRARLRSFEIVAEVTELSATRN